MPSQNEKTLLVFLGPHNLIKLQGAYKNFWRLQKSIYEVYLMQRNKTLYVTHHTRAGKIYYQYVLLPSLLFFIELVTDRHPMFLFTYFNSCEF